MPSMPEYDPTIVFAMKSDIGPDSDNLEQYDAEDYKLDQQRENWETWLIWTNTEHVPNMNIW